MDKQKLNERIEALEKELNELKKEVNKKEDVLKDGDCYWYISGIGEVLMTTYHNAEYSDVYRLYRDNIWLNGIDCHRYNTIDKKYRKLVYELNLENPIDFKDSKNKYYIYFSYEQDKLDVTIVNTVKFQGIFCGDKDILKKAIQLISEEDLTWYIKNYRAEE